MKTKVNAKLLLASYNEQTDDTLYTWELTFPRTILAEVNTHRMASRNTSSSRAISIKKLRHAVYTDPFIPVSLGQNQRGMQAGEEILGWRRSVAFAVIRAGRYPALFQNWLLDLLGVAKQVTNRYVEPWMWCKQLFSATAVNNFLMLRTDKGAEPHFRELARQMQMQVRLVQTLIKSGIKTASNTGVVTGSGTGTGATNDIFGVQRFQRLQPGKWHLPYVTPDDLLFTGLSADSVDDLITLSVARCANTSYTMAGESSKIDFKRAVEIAQKLFGGHIKHLSPCEHQAIAMPIGAYYANFRGFQQYRATIPNERGGDL